MDDEVIAFDVKEARRRLGNASHSAFYKLVREGRLVIRKMGNRTLVTPEDLRACIKGLPKVGGGQ
jgi:hypothetical protein